MDKNIQEVSSYSLTDYNTGEINKPEPSEYSLKGSVIGRQSFTGIGDNIRIDLKRSKYDPNDIYSYNIPHLEDIRANNQGVFDALGRSTMNLLGKTGLNVVGGIGGFAYGAIDSIANGDFRRLWDNDFNRMVDTASESVGDYFKVYKSGDYHDMNILQKAFLHPIQFIDEFMDALSFTTGAVVTEMLTSGMASGLVAAKALKYFKNIDKAAEATQVGKNLGNISNRFMRGIGNGATLTRQLATGAAWEASVEARHTAKQMEEDMIRQWQGENPGVEITEEILDQIAQNSSNAGMFTFLTNIALVGGSNLIQFPKIFGSGYNTAKRGAANRIRYNPDTGKYVDEFTNELSKTSRRLRNIYTGLKNPFMEGIVEEGGQGVLSGTASNYWDLKNDPDAKFNVERFLESFGTAFIDTYTTKEGWNEIGMGMLIGSLGAPGRGALSVLGKDSNIGKMGFNKDGTRRELWTGGIAGSFQERDSRDQEVAAMVDRINQNTDFMKAAKAHYDFLVKADSLQAEQDIYFDAEDIFNFKNIEDDFIHSYISSRIDAGLNEDLDTLISQLESTDAEDFYDAFRGEETETETPINEQYKAEFKRKSIDSLKRRIKNTREAYNIVNSNYTGDNNDLKEQLIYTIASAKNLDTREIDINDRLYDLSNGHITDSNLRSSDIVSAVNSVELLQESLKNPDITEAEKTEIEGSIKRVVDVLKATKKDVTVAEAEMLADFIQNNPTESATNLKEIVDLLKDSRKLRNRRENLINLYNTLFTEEGQKKFENFQKQVEETKNKEIKEAERAAKRKEEYEARARREKEAKDKQEEIKKKAESSKKKAKEELTPVESTEETVEETPIESTDTTEEVPTETDLTKSEEAVMKIVDFEEVAETQKELNSDGRVVPKSESRLKKYSEKFKDVIDSTRKRAMANTIISLNIEYVENVLGNVGNKQDIYNIWDQYDDEGNLIINKNFDSRLQDPNQFSVGSPVNIIFPTFEQIQEKGIGNLTGNEYNRKQYEEDLKSVETIPIAFTDINGKIIGYLPTTDNVRKRVAEQELTEEINNNISLRKRLLENRDKVLSTVITDKSSGTPMFSRNKRKLYDGLGNGTRLSEGVRIGVFKNGRMRTGLNTIVTDKILPDGLSYEEAFEEGVSYAIIPTADKTQYFAFSLDISRINESLANSVVKMIQLYRANKSFPSHADLIAEREALSHEIDLSDYQGFMTAVEKILYIDRVNHIFEVDTKNKKIRLGVTSDKIFDLDKFMTDEKVRQEVANELKKRFPAVRLTNFNQRFDSFELGEDGKLSHVPYRNYFDYLNSHEILTTRIQGQPIEGTDKLYFTAQSVIEIGDVNIGNRALKADIEETTKIDNSGEQTVAKTKKRTNPLGARKPTKKTKPKIERDNDVLFNLDTNDSGIPIKEDVSEIFDENPELANIGTQEQYSQYLNTVFPNSEVKDIVYHGGTFGSMPHTVDLKTYEELLEKEKNKTITSEVGQGMFQYNSEVEVLEKYRKEIEKSKTFNRDYIGASGFNGLYDLGYGFYFGTKVEAKGYGTPKPYLINIVNPLFTSDKDYINKLDKFNKNIDYDGVIDDSNTYNNVIQEYSVYNSEQIHIIGSQQDIQGFREFVKEESKSNSLEIQAKNLMRICGIG